MPGKCLILLLCLLLPCCAMAESGILPALPTRNALSFSQVTAAEPLIAVHFARNTMTDRCWLEVYADVTPEQYYAFSAALGTSGFELVNSEVSRWKVTALVRSTTAEMEIRYREDFGILEAIYTLGVPATTETVPDTEEKREALLALMLKTASNVPADVQDELLTYILHEFPFSAILPASPENAIHLEETTEFLAERVQEYLQALYNQAQ